MQAATQGAIFAWLCTREGEQIRIFELADYLSFLAVGYPVRLQSARLTHNQQILLSNLVSTTLYRSIGRTRDGEDSVTKTDEASATLRRKAKVTARLRYFCFCGFR